MPRFDSIARAAVTPGGFQAGVNDIVASIMNADAQKAQAAQRAQEQQGQDELQNARLAEMIRSNMAGEQGQMTRHQEGLGMEKQRLGEMVRHNTAMENRPGYQANEGLEEKRGFDLDLAQANVETLGNPEGVAWIDQSVPDPFGLSEPVVKKVKGPPDAGKIQARDKRLAELRAMRAGAPAVQNRIVDQVVPKTGTAPASAGTPTTPVVGGPTAQARQPIDFNALDAKLQASDPGYRQWRAGKPAEVWQKAIADQIQKGTLSP